MRSVTTFLHWMWVKISKLFHFVVSAPKLENSSYNVTVGPEFLLTIGYFPYELMTKVKELVIV